MTREEAQEANRVKTPDGYVDESEFHRIDQNASQPKTRQRAQNKEAK